MISARCLATAKLQFLRSSLIICNNVDGIEKTLLKTLAFSSYQMMTVWSPFGEEHRVAAKLCQY